MVTTDPLAEGIEALGAPTDWVMLTARSARAVLNEIRGLTAGMGKHAMELRRLHDSLHDANQAIANLRAERERNKPLLDRAMDAAEREEKWREDHRKHDEVIRNLRQVNDQLAAAQVQHAEESDEVAAAIAVALSEDLETAEDDADRLARAVTFYRGLALNGTRINDATDAAFLWALDLVL